MKYILILTILITSILGCQIASKNPKDFRTSKDTINFGLINYSDTFNTVIKIFNESENILKLINIESSCGCTSLIIKDSTVAKFDSIQFGIRYIPSNSFDSGKVLKRLTIRTNAETAFKNLVIIGEVKK